MKQITIQEALSYFELTEGPNFQSKRSEGELKQELENFKQRIKKAYRKVALKHHPDKGGNAERMKQINGLYSMFMEMRIEIMRRPNLNKHYHQNCSTTTSTTWY